MNIGIRPMLCETADTTIKKSEWYAELKYDGERALVVLSKVGTKIYNRQGKEITYKFPELIVEPNGHEAVLDGEIVVNDGTKSDFQLLQRRMNIENKFRIQHIMKEIPTRFVAFDCLFSGGVSWINDRMEVRKGICRSIVCSLENRNYDVAMYTDFSAFSKVSSDYEGLILKRKGSKYEIGKRSKNWLKLKNTKTIDAIICGFTDGCGHRKSTFGALILGTYTEKGTLIEIGKVGSGFTEKDLIEIRRMLNPLVVEKEREINYVKPCLVCEVKYLAISTDKKLRQPVFVRLRTDKKAEECIFS